MTSPWIVSRRGDIAFIFGGAAASLAAPLLVWWKPQTLPFLYWHLMSNFRKDVRVFRKILLKAANELPAPRELDPALGRSQEGPHATPSRDETRAGR